MTINRATLPGEFYDRTSSMLLVQPDFQFLHAMLFKMALSASLDVSSGLGLPGREISGSGAGQGSDKEGQFQLSDPIYSEALTVVPEIGKGQGHTIRINRPKFTDTTYTQASRRVATNATISTTPADLGSEQVSVTVERFAGPYDSTNSRVAPYAVDRLDASMSVHNLVNVAGRHLKRDYDHTMDSFLVTCFDAVQAANVLFPRGATANTDMTVDEDNPFDLDLFWRGEQTLDDLKIPQFANGRRVAVFTPRQIRQLKQDNAFIKQASFHKDINPLLAPAYEATLGKTDIFKSSTLTTATSSAATIHYGQMFGPGMVGAGVARYPEVVPSTADNYGEQALVIWVTYMGLATLDSRFGLSLRSS